MAYCNCTGACKIGQCHVATANLKTLGLLPLSLRDLPAAPTNYGWICPDCRRGNAPHVSTCSCKPMEYKIT